MQSNMDKIITLIYASLDEIESFIDLESPLKKDLDQPLFTKNGPLDSMGLVNLLITLEEKIDSEFNKSVQLMRADFLQTEQNPLASVESLSIYVFGML